MAEIMLARGPGSLTDAEREVMRRALFGLVDGVDEAARKSWRRFWSAAMKREPGECFAITTWLPRNGKFHRLHMALEQAVFNAQERFADFDAFRDWIKVGAGHVKWLPGPFGGVIPIPQSISYAELDDAGMAEFHAKALAFLREGRPQKVLWPHLKQEQRAEMMAAVLDEFER